MSETATLTLSEFLRERLGEEQRTWQEVASDSLQAGMHRLATFMLEDIVSKREIVDLHSGDNDEACQSYAGNWTHQPCATLRLLAAPYRRHADFREEWS